MPDLTVRENQVLSAVFDDLPKEPEVTEALISELRHELAGWFREASTRVTGLGVRIDSYRLKKAIECPASAQGEQEFRWSTLFAARGLALGALRDLPEGRGDVLAAVYHRITEEIAEGRSLGIWLGSVSPSARAAIAASASAWATRACLTVPWRSVERVIFTPQSTWYRPVPRSNAIVLVGRPDAVVLVRGSRAQERVLLRIGSHDCVAVELDLLVASLDRGRAPLRYVTVTPATGEIKADRVDKRALRSAVDRIQHALPVLTGQSNDATPGSQCRWCELRSGCQPGKVWMEKNSLMGRLPVAAIEAEIPSDRNGAD